MKKKKIFSILLIMTIVMTMNFRIVCAATGAEPGTKITRVGLAVGLYGSKYNEDDGDGSGASKKDGGATFKSGKASASSGKSGSEIAAAGGIKAVASNAVEALVQDYKEGRGVFELNEASRFFIASGNKPTDEMLSTVRLMDAQFAGMELPTDKALPVVYAEESYAREGDIVLKVVPEAEFSPGIDAADINEAYELVIDDKAEITACGIDGIYYGLLTLMEMAAEKTGNNINDDTVTLDCCEISDGPDVKERTVLLDCGRKYFTKEWIENFIRRASLQRYNAIELHFSEAEGLRFDSKLFPWLTEDIDSLSREDMADIIKVARTYHMDVIPSIDMPGHNEYIVKTYAKYVKANPDWSFVYDGKRYDSSVEGFGSIANHYSYKGKTKKADYIGIDVTDEHAVAFVDALIDDYAKFFKAHGCTKFDIGGDELLGWYNVKLGKKTFTYENRWDALGHWEKYAREELGIENGSASDTFVNYLNTVAKRLEGFGYTCRIFNDEININDDQHIKLRESVEIIMWSRQAGNYLSITEAGHNVYINPELWTYYVVREQDGADIMKNKYASVNAQNIYEHWNPLSFTARSGTKYTPETDQMAGAYFNIWCDHPKYKSSDKIWKETELKMWANATKMWNPEIDTDESGIGDALSYKNFRAFALKLDGFPGYSGDPNEAARLAEASDLISAKSLLTNLTKGRLFCQVRKALQLLEF